MPAIADLNQTFAIRDHVSFHDRLDDTGRPTGLVELRIATATAEATLMTQGAHLVRWNPIGQQPVLYLSPKSSFAPGKAIRGGVPVLFPWFANGWDGKHSPMHGFARISEWTVESTHLDPAGDVHVTFSLSPCPLNQMTPFAPQDTAAFTQPSSSVSVPRSISRSRSPITAANR